MTGQEALRLKRNFRRTALDRDDQGFLQLLSTLGLLAWCLVLWGQQFPPIELTTPKEEPIRVAKVFVKPPPPPKEEPKPEPEPPPLPPRQETEKPKPAPAPKQQAAPRPPAGEPKPAPAPPKRQVASMGLLSVLSSRSPREAAPSQRIGPVVDNVRFRDEDVSEDVGSLTGTVGARRKASAGEMVAGLPRGSGTKVVLEGSVVTAVAGPGGGASVSGADGGVSGRSFDEIRRIVAAYVPGLKYLYDKELKRNPSLHGKVTVEFVITGPGRVTNVRLVASQLGHASLEGSILSRIGTWKFPEKPGDATRVTFPFDFVPPAS